MVGREGYGQRDCAIDMAEGDDNFVESLKRKLNPPADRPSECTISCIISRVPSHLREVVPEAFDPKIVSIGPYHRSRANFDLKAMDEYKRICLRKFLSKKTDIELKDYIEKIRAVEAEARSYYTNDLNMSGDEFVEMILLDGYFILELFRIQSDEEYDPIRGNNWTLPLVALDMLMLENQLPLFVLELLSRIFFKMSPFSLKKLAMDFFADLVPGDQYIPWANFNEHFDHLLHLFHHCITRPMHSFNDRFDKSEPAPRLEMIPSATELGDAGIMTQRRMNGDGILDVKFQRNILEIPPIKISDTLCSMLQNLIAFELCYRKSGDYITIYVVLMNCLIKTTDDIELLQSKSIIQNVLCDKFEASQFFRKLGKSIVLGRRPYYLAGLFMKVRRSYAGRWSQLMVKLMQRARPEKGQRYNFRNPFLALSLVAGVIVFLLQCTQTVFAILQYVSSS